MRQLIALLHSPRCLLSGPPSSPLCRRAGPAATPAASQRALLLQVHAKGDQVYTCKADAAQFTWTLKAPTPNSSTKMEALRQTFRRTFLGSNDGSRVTGKAVANAPSPDANSIPSPINIVTHDGSGVLSRATTIQRLNTKGGKAPASGCDASHVGQEVRVPYSADYLFFAPKCSLPL